MFSEINILEKLFFKYALTDIEIILLLEHLDSLHIKWLHMTNLTKIKS